LLGSQDEDEGEEEDGIIVGQDFAAAMAAARERLMSSSGSSSADVEWDGNEQWDTPYDQVQGVLLSLWALEATVLCVYPAALVADQDHSTAHPYDVIFTVSNSTSHLGYQGCSGRHICVLHPVTAPLAIACAAGLQDFWSTDKERVYLVGAAYKQQYQQQQQRQQQQQQERQQRQRQSSSGSSRPRSLFDLPTSRSSVDVSTAAGSNGSGTTDPAAAAVAAAAAAVDESTGTGSSSSSRRQQGPQQVSYSVEESIEELGRLADTAGLQVCLHSLYVMVTHTARVCQAAVISLMASGLNDLKTFC
jgi:hypothetical protein